MIEKLLKDDLIISNGYGYEPSETIFKYGTITIGSFIIEEDGIIAVRDDHCQFITYVDESNQEEFLNKISIYKKISIPESV